MTDRHSRFAVTVAVPLALAFGAACGGGHTLRMTGDENDPARLAAAIARVPAARAAPANALGRPLAFLVADRGKALIAFDLDARSSLWKVAADVTSRVVVGRDVVAHREGGSTLVARDIRSGQPRWTRPLGGELAGCAADDTAVYCTVGVGEGEGAIVAFDASNGDIRWRIGADGAVGTPAARGGVVFVPFRKQWLAVVDGRSGDELTRILATDEEISFARATSTDVTFGSRTGVVLVDARAASGKRSESTHGAAKLPAELRRLHYHWDGFDPVQAGYSAYDRNRILWRAAAAERALRFAGDRVIVHHFRFLFGFDPATGALAWAYSHPRVDLVGSEHLGSGVAFASATGGLGVIDPVDGTPIYRAEVKAALVGATFDADGWQPPRDAGGRPEGSTVAALIAIAHDRDARFADIKQFAVVALARMPGGDPTRELVGLLTDERTPPALVEAVAAALIARRKTAGLPHLTAALAQRHDFIAGTEPRGIGVVARAIAALDGKTSSIEPADRSSALEGLVAHLQSPALSTEDLTSVVRAMAAIGDGAEVGPLSSFALMYRADPAFGSAIEPVAAAIDALVARGGAADREVVAYIARDPRTLPPIAEHARRALAASENTRQDPGDAAGGAAE